MLIFLVAYGIFVWFALVTRMAINLNCFINETEKFLFVYYGYLQELMDKLKTEDINDGDVHHFCLKEEQTIIFEFDFTGYKDVLWQTIMHIDWLIQKYERAKWLTRGTIVLPEMRYILESIYASCVSRLEEIEKTESSWKKITKILAIIS